MSSRPQRSSIRIDRLDLDLRGIDPAAAEAAVRLLGPALAAAFAQRGGGSVSRAAKSIDAGRVAATNEPHALASRLARRIADSTQAE